MISVTALAVLLAVGLLVGAAVAAFHDAAPGVTVLDSTELTLEQVVDAICALVPAAYEPSVAR